MGETSRAIELTSGTARWYAHGVLLPVRWVLVRDPLGRFAPQAPLSTDLALDPLAIVQHVVHRWQVEVTFEEARRHLGLETQRQCSDRAIARTTPILRSLFSLVVLHANRLVRAGTLPVHANAWYQKSTPTFSDALVVVRVECWRDQRFSISTCRAEMPKPARRLRTRLTLSLCEAA